MAQVARCAWCAWCAMHKQALGKVLIVSESDDNKSWLGYACMHCYERLDAPIVRTPIVKMMAAIDFDDLSDDLKSDVAILRLAPEYKHVNGVGIRVGNYYEVVLLED